MVFGVKDYNRPTTNNLRLSPDHLSQDCLTLWPKWSAEHDQNSQLIVVRYCRSVYWIPWPQKPYPRHQDHHPIMCSSGDIVSWPKRVRSSWPKWSGDGRTLLVMGFLDSLTPKPYPRHQNHLSIMCGLGDIVSWPKWSGYLDPNGQAMVVCYCKYVYWIPWPQKPYPRHQNHLPIMCSLGDIEAW